ncbi:claudin-11a [Synchiropus splendidus]|uniref:claudin-11a n=1 Tax=Synchiropus splendidus TaxID=270530 RepID=UPI00237DCE6C|nr:claudin-11a [Synchiropus splendidus]
MAIIHSVGVIFCCGGWLGIVIAASTNDWVTLCKHNWNACQWMDSMGRQGPWADCPYASRLYQCITHQILDLPAYIQATRALMVIGSILGLPALLLLVMSMPCIKQSEDQKRSKNGRIFVGGVLMLVVAACGLVSTVWFPIGANQEQPLVSFNVSLYIGWTGTLLCLFGGLILVCSAARSAPRSYQDSRVYYSKQGGGAAPSVPAANHATSTHV